MDYEHRSGHEIYDGNWQANVFISGIGIVTGWGDVCYVNMFHVKHNRNKIVSRSLGNPDVK